MVRLLSCALLLLDLAAFAQKKPIRPPKPGGGPYSSGVESGDLVYVSGHVGPEPGGGFAPGDVRTQTRRCLELVGKVLAEAGLSHKHIVSTTLYLADIRTAGAADAAWREFFPADFPARTSLESQLLVPEALVEVSAVAVRDLSNKKIIRPEGWPLPVGPFSYAVDAAGTLFMSGLRPVHPVSGQLAGNTIHSQALQVMENQEAILAAAGMSFADMAATRIYLTEPTDYAGLNEVYRKFVTAPPPARATLQTQPVEVGHLVQFQSVAVKASGEGRPSGEGITSPIHSYAVKAGRKLYITGMTGRQPDGKFARADIREQTRQALKTIGEQLARHGMTFADTVDSVVWIRDGRLAQAMNEVYREVVKPGPPARATVRIAPSSSEALIEIMMIASK
jgi:2-iminobutanoate/2-iminopropanoate deaminase